MRHDWSLEEIRSIHNMPLLQLILRASQVHREHHTEGEVQCAQIVNVKVGGCEEDCGYCGQSSRYTTHVTPQAMLSVEDVLKDAIEAKNQGVSRVCLSAAWRGVRNGKAFDTVLEMVKKVKELGVEVCCTLGLLQDEHIARLKEAGIYSINHNLDTSEAYYPQIISTRTYADRLDTIERVRKAGISVCSGGIIGMGESLDDRLSMLQTLAALNPHPDSLPINVLVPIEGTPAAQSAQPTAWELIRMVATARIMMPKAMVRLSGGRIKLSLTQQALCFLAGANSIHTGSQLLVTPNPGHNIDQDMFRTLGLTPQPPYKKEQEVQKAVIPDTIDQHMTQALAKRHEQGTHRKLIVAENRVDLTSNDYLGFARSRQLLNNINNEFDSLVKAGGIRPYVGATGSRLLTGNNHYVEALEKELARFHDAEAGLLFNSGYTANLGLLSAVIGPEDSIILDTQVHASTWEGAKLSQARQLLFRHNDVEHLRTQLAKATGRIFVCVESLYSMSGDIAPLEAICDVCEEFGANIIVDEAHATGIYGENGRGIVYAHKLQKRIFARLHTFSKSLGTHGAIILGSATLRDYLINFSRPLIYTTAFPLHTLVSIHCAYDMMHEAYQERQTLHALIMAFKAKIQATQLPVKTTDTPIQTIQIAGVDNVKAISAKLAQEGLDVRAILSPTVRRNEECLRICLHSFNQVNEIDRLVNILSEAAESAIVA
ncbi:MAG: biotin synthase BioB [Nitrosomonas sp.]|nr:MAG: biotin synthase BioB [Nitrosomonas sp.]